MHWSKDDHKRGVPVVVANHRRRSVDYRNDVVVGRRVVFNWAQLSNLKDTSEKNIALGILANW